MYDCHTEGTEVERSRPRVCLPAQHASHGSAAPPGPAFRGGVGIIRARPLQDHPRCIVLRAALDIRTEPCRLLPPVETHKRSGGVDHPPKHAEIRLLVGG